MKRNKRFLKSLSVEQMTTLKNAGMLKKRFKIAVRKAIKRVKYDLINQNNEIKKLALKLCRNFRVQSNSKLPNQLKQFLQESLKGLPSLSEKPEGIQKSFVRKARLLLVDQPTVLAKKATKIQGFLRLVQRHFELSKTAQSNCFEQSKFVTLPPGNKLNRSLRFIMRRPKLPSATSFFAQSFNRQVDNFPALRSSEVECSLESRRAYRTFLQVNKPKYEHCFKVHQNMKIIDKMELDQLITGIRNTIVRVSDVKKTLYCAICDGDSQRYFNGEKSLVLLDEEFCRDLVGSYRDYIEFSNVVMVQFGEQLLQYIACINSLPQEISLPFVTRFEFHKRNIFFFKKCFDNVLSDDYMRYCHFICSTFNFDSFSKYIDGDMQLMYNVYLEIVDFTRNNDIDFDTSLILDESFLQSLNTGFYPSMIPRSDNRPVVPLTQRQIELERSNNFKGNLNNFQVGNFSFKLNLTKTTYSDEEKPIASDSEIFTRVKKIFSLKTARYLFMPNHNGLNPLSLLSSAFLQVESDNFITDYYKQLNEGREIAGSTLQTFFNIKTSEIESFNTDIDMDFQTDLVHKPPEITSPFMKNINQLNEDQGVNVKRSEREEIETNMIF